MPNTAKLDANSFMDMKNLFMALLIGLVAWQFDTNMESRKRFEQLIISNDKRLNDRAMWMRVTDIRLATIERKLGIVPIDTDTGLLKLD